MIDIDEIRNAAIKMHGLSKADAVYTFFHDETNNIKKLRLHAYGLNVAEPAIFVLGGIVHEGPPRSLDIQALRDALRIQRSAAEIKLRHVGKGDFLDLLKSDKLYAFLQWISDSELVVQYQALDPLYWSLVDIIDSILFGLGQPSLTAIHADLKADLATLLRADLDVTTKMLFRHNYPDLAPESLRPFLNELLEMLMRSEGILPHFNAMMLKGVLQAGCNLPSLVFIEKSTPHLLIDSFTAFYLNRVAVFKYSSHILDMEDSVRDELDKAKLSSNGIAVTHYRFADSKLEPGIQIADIMIGVIGKMHTYFVQTPHDDVAEARASLSGVSLKNAELMRNLIDTSHKTNIAFLNHICSIRDIDKMNLFLRNRGTAYEE